MYLQYVAVHISDDFYSINANSYLYWKIEEYYEILKFQLALRLPKKHSKLY